jgi:hypothetical protein
MSHGDHREEIVVDHPHSFDTSEPKGAFIAIFGIGVIITLVATFLGLQFYFDQAKEEEVYNLQLAPESQQLRDLHSKEDTQLYSYGYIDRAKGAVRLPVDRAMDLVIKEAAENRQAYPTANVRIKTPEEIAAATAAAIAGKPSATEIPTTNATPAPHK